MARDTKIQWCNHTFNPWRGCSRVSEGCRHCYAEAWAKRNPAILGEWGPQGTRVVASETQWREPLKWDREAQAAGTRAKVFCASLADFFEAWDGPMIAANGNPLWKCLGSWSSLPVPNTGLPADCRMLTMDDIRERLLFLVRDTPNLDWLVLTKRPANILNTLERIRWDEPAEQLPNLWIGTSIENQEVATTRIPQLLQVPVKVRFLSMEPLLGPVNLTRLRTADTTWLDCLSGREHIGLSVTSGGPTIDWVIVGGESGSEARPIRLDCVQQIVKQCREANVPCFVKQLGARVVNDVSIPLPLAGVIEAGGPGYTMRLRDPKGGDISEFPECLQVREFPKLA